MKTIMFDKSCMGWMENADANLLFVQHRAHYIEDLSKLRGYIYLNQICESFGIGWDPSDENVCYDVRETGVPKFKFEPVGYNTILIHIS